LLKPQSRDTYAEAISLFERALTLDPGSVGAQSWLASSLASRLMEGMTDSRAVDIARAEGLSRQALAASPRSPLAHHARGQVLRAQDRYKEAIPEYEAAIAFNRNWVSSISALADCKLHAGPIGTAYLLQSRTDEAIVWLEKARDANPARFTPHAFLASAYGLKGETVRAVAEHAEARRLENNGVARLKARYSVVPRIRTLFEATYLAGLRTAGLPEE
jgi:tetratricopeptide (TPR) repeat protein